jgi:ubiquinol-cytochrome c reductase cytochrome c subunit
VIRLVRWWLTRRAWVPRPIRAALAILLTGLALLGWAAPSPGSGSTPPAQAGAPGGGSGNVPIAARPTKLPKPPSPADPTKMFPDSPALRAEGFTLYQRSCSSCHGIAVQGIRGVAPSLRGVGAGPVDFYLSTGRMPLEQPREEPLRNRPLFSRGQIDALIAYVASFGGPAAPTADPSKGNLARGLHEFTLNCAGCHQMVARGGMTAGAQIPNLQEATPQQIAEAVRMGPYLMPNFSAKQIDQHDLDSIARYVQWTRRPADAGGWGIYNIGPIPEGIVTWWIGLAALLLTIRLIGERVE